MGGYDTLEVTNSGKSKVEESVHEFVHLFTAESYFCADLHALTELEVSNGLLCESGNSLLAGDESEIAHDGVDNLGIFLSITCADIDYDLVDIEKFVISLVFILQPSVRTMVPSVADIFLPYRKPQ